MRPLGRPKNRQEDYIEMDLMEQFHLVQNYDLVAGSCGTFSEPSGFMKCWEFLDKVSEY
jgi:hypothetical protein